MNTQHPPTKCINNAQTAQPQLITWRDEVLNEPKMAFLLHTYGKKVFRVLSPPLVLDTNGCTLVEVDVSHPMRVRTWLLLDFFRAA